MWLKRMSRSASLSGTGRDEVGRLSAFAALAEPASRAYYDRKRDEGKKHNAALICLARRRVDVLHAMLRARTPYHHNHWKSSPSPLDRTHRDPPQSRSMDVQRNLMKDQVIRS